jgi:hypothetical protein
MCIIYLGGSGCPYAHAPMFCLFCMHSTRALVVGPTEHLGFIHSSCSSFNLSLLRPLSDLRRPRARLERRTSPAIPLIPSRSIPMLTRSDGVESTLVELFDPSGLLSRQDPAPIPTPPRSNDEDSFRLCMELSGASWGSTRRSIPRTTEDASPAIQTPHETTHNTTTLTSGPLAISTLDVAPLLPRSTVNDPITPRTRSLAHHRPFARAACNVFDGFVRSRRGKRQSGRSGRIPGDRRGEWDVWGD